MPRGGASRRTLGVSLSPGTPAFAGVCCTRSQGTIPGSPTRRSTRAWLPAIAVVLPSRTARPGSSSALAHRFKAYSRAASARRSKFVDHWRARRGGGERLDGAAAGGSLGEWTGRRAGRQGGEDQAVHEHECDPGGDERPHGRQVVELEAARGSKPAWAQSCSTTERKRPAGVSRRGRISGSASS
jgi:hypothetical protein